MINCVALVAKAGMLEAAGELIAIATWLKARGVEAIFDSESAALAGAGGEWRALPKDELPREVDLVLVLAGDGTLLGMADRIAEAGRRVPILGVNFGALGFLTEITLPELYPALEATLEGRATIEERLMLRSSVRRHGEVLADRVLLNDVVVTRGPLSRIIDLSVSVGGHFVARFTADGIILATPTGSTAYNLSAGGPIVHPGIHALVLTPICPHILTNRPVVIPATEEVRLQPLARDGADEVYATFDGQSGLRLQPDEVVSIRPAQHTMQLVHASTRSYFEVLRRKLKWAER